jgi:hypothetical protein
MILPDSQSIKWKLRLWYVMPFNLVDKYQHSIGIYLLPLLGTENGAGGSSKYWYIRTKPHGITSEKTATITITDKKHSYLKNAKFDDGAQTSLITTKFTPAPFRGVTRTDNECVHPEPCSPIRLHSLVIRHRGDQWTMRNRAVVTFLTNGHTFK